MPDTFRHCLAALALSALAAILAFAVTVAMTMTADNAAATVDLAARQCSLGQRVALEAMLLDRAEAPGRVLQAATLRDSAKLLLASHLALISGDAALIRQALAMDIGLQTALVPTVTRSRLPRPLRRLYLDGPAPLDPLLRQYVAAAQHLALEAEDPLRGMSSLVFILRHGPGDLASRLQAAVTASREIGEAQLRALCWVATTLWGILLILLGRAAFLLRRMSIR